MADKDRKLVRTVRVRDDDGVDHVFGPGDDVPSWAVEKIANPGAWGEDDRAPIDAPLDPDEVAEKAEAEREKHDEDQDDEDEEGAADSAATPSRSSSSRSSSSRSPRAASRARSS